MSKKTVYVCNNCGKEDAIFPILGVEFKTIQFLPLPLDFCSKKCFIEYIEKELQDFKEDE